MDPASSNSRRYAASGASLADAQELELSEFEDFCQQAGLATQGPHAAAVVNSCFSEASGDFSHSHRKAQKGSGARRGSAASLFETQHTVW